MKRARGIIFDCDGVLFESREANLAYYNTVFERCGFDLVQAEDEDKVRICHTRSTPEVFRLLLDPFQAQQAQALAKTVDYKQFTPLMVPEPDLPVVLERLSQDLPLAVATNRGRGARDLLAFFHLEHYFAAIVSSADVQRPKPSPDMLLLAARRLGFDPGELLFVGDSELDYRAAEEAGIPFVGYKNRFGNGIFVNRHRELLVLLGLDGAGSQ